MSDQLYPFSKNRYFKRKRMRTVDFQREQSCIENKLSFLNHWTFGDGIALGLGVRRIDSESLLVEQGLALDPQGRYLIVDEPAICRFRTLDGFDNLTGEEAILWLSYNEESFDPMFIADETGEFQDFAGARERFQFSLSDMQTLPCSAEEKFLFSDTVLYEDGELCVRQVIPRVLSSRQYTELRLILENFRLEPMEVKLFYAPEIPGFVSTETGVEPQVNGSFRLQPGETAVVVTISSAAASQEVCFSLPEDGFWLEKGGVRKSARHGFQERFAVVSGTPVEALRATLLSQSIQDLWGDTGKNGIPIAGVRFVRCEEMCLLDNVFPLGKRHQVALPYLEERLRHCGEFYSDVLPKTTEVTEAPVDPRRLNWAEQHMGRNRMTTGTVTLRTGLHMTSDKVLRSEEIVHDLGPGTVFVEFGVENVYPAENLDRNRTDLLLGDVSLFQRDGSAFRNAFNTGVRIHPDTGTFELAIRLGGQLRQADIQLRWFAWRPDVGVEREQKAGALIRLEPDVLHAKPGTVINFTPVFSGGVGSPCDFFVEGRRSGIITRDGVYTVPEREGLYQICVKTRERPEEKASAFVIVRQEIQDESAEV